MRAFRDISIKHKMTLIIMLINSVALLLTGLTAISFDHIKTGKAMVQKLELLADIIGINSTAALTFENENDANRILEALRVEKHVLAAGIYKSDGKAFAKYHRAGVHPDKLCVGCHTAPEPAELERQAKSGFEDIIRTHQRYNRKPADNKLIVFRPIVLEEEKIGVAYVVSDIEEMLSRLSLFVQIIALAMLASLLAAFVLSARLQRIISRPIVHLANVARNVSVNKNYSLRAKKASQDETGFLIESFNSMLAGIQDRDEELKRSEERFRSVFENVSIGIYRTTPDGRFLLANPAMVAMLGYSSFEELAACNLESEGFEAVYSRAEFNRRMQQDGKIEGFESTWRRPDGAKIHVREYAKAFQKEAGGTEYYEGTLEDISERVLAQQRQMQLVKEIESVNQELKDFAYIVSHDLKAPLRAIGSLADWLHKDYSEKLDEEGREIIALITNRVKRLHNLIEGVLQYSRVGRIREDLVQVDLQKTLPEIIDLLSPPSSIEIKVTNRLPTVVFEKTRIEQVFQNLLSNAIKYMDKPCGHIAVGCLAENGCWKFSVADDGPGIEEKHFGKIFQIFQTLAPRDQVESTGIGLTLVKKIVEMYGGSIWVESQVGKGSTFYFTLPREKTGILN